MEWDQPARRQMGVERFSHLSSWRQRKPNCGNKFYRDGQYRGWGRPQRPVSRRRTTTLSGTLREGDVVSYTIDGKAGSFAVSIASGAFDAVDSAVNVAAIRRDGNCSICSYSVTLTVLKINFVRITCRFSGVAGDIASRIFRRRRVHYGPGCN